MNKLFIQKVTSSPDWGDEHAVDPRLGDCYQIENNSLDEHLKPIITLSAIYVVVSTTPALAYIDPVTGSFLLQAIIGGFATALVAIRRVREKLLGFLGFRKPEAETVDVAEDSANS